MSRNGDPSLLCQLDISFLYPLSLTQVKALYIKGLNAIKKITRQLILKASADSGNYDNSGDLFGYWKFNDGTGFTHTDSTSNSNNGTLTNMDSSDWVMSSFNLVD